MTLKISSILPATLNLQRQKGTLTYKNKVHVFDTETNMKYISIYRVVYITPCSKYDMLLLLEVNPRFVYVTAKLIDINTFKKIDDFFTQDPDDLKYNYNSLKKSFWDYSEMMQSRIILDQMVFKNLLY